MAFVVVTSLLEIVEQQLLQPNPSLMLCNKEMIVLLSHKLHFLQAFLEEFGKNTKDPQAKEMLDTEIRDFAADAEGKIESQLSPVYLAANKEEYVVVACQELNQTLEQVVKDIGPIETRILMHKANTASLVGSSTNDFKKENIMIGGTSQKAVEPQNETIVGFSKDIGDIVNLLTHSKSMEREVIALVGEGGIGKTTLANEVFKNPDITAHFNNRAWVVVSQEHNLKEMLIGLLRCIVPITSEISNKDETQLAEQLSRSLTGHRYFIVLDDVWTTTAWDAIQECFPHNFNGSRVMITTRFLDVASKLSVYFHSIKFLDTYYSWRLFSSKVFGKRNSCPPNLEVLGREIVNQCKGLPLAILVIAGLLATAKGSLQVWRDVAETLARIDDGDNRISRILSLSYNYLPSHLKACFLYFGIFPEDSDIPVEKIINLWVAEGFLKPKNNKSLEEVAEICLLDLINRSLVQANEQSIDGKIKSCKIHDRLHEICVREAKKENIVCIISENHAPDSNRWISSQSRHWPITQASYGNHTSGKIGSILYFGKDLYLSKCRLAYPCLKLLRVLDLSLIKYSQGMPSGIAGLIHLRYLALSTIGSLYKLRFLKLQNLQTLIVSSWMEECPLQLPYDILVLPQLRHLRLQKRCSQYLPCVVRENLQTLYWLRVASSDQKLDFGLVRNLKELGIHIESELAIGCLENLVHLRLLEKLKLEIGRVVQFSLPTAFPSNLKKLTLCYTYLPWEEMSIIDKLPNLEVLKLKDFAFCGPEWEPMEGGFQRLKVLLISRSDLIQWNAKVDHFPVLECLVLRYCWDLKKVPIAFAKVASLKLIELDSCYSSLVTSANQISSANHAIRVHHLRTEVDMPKNESSKEGSVESSEEGTVESSEEGSDESSEEESTEISEEERLKALKMALKYLKKDVSKAPNKRMLKDLKKEVSEALRRK